MTEHCPWCDEPLTASADPIRITPNRGRSRGLLLHHQCAVEWESFITRAQGLATGGHRWSLITGPLERGWNLESGIDDPRLVDGA
ncbi:hypothetical protein [Halorientalis salina]|uniref:hypothetical protein n=1 Tax=Halorientalis salina TaxID=2932266 RepID=UPI0010AC6449|nr:hypothetical protein [Halorientalis salina]